MRTNVEGEVAVLVVGQPSNVWGAQRRLLDLAPHLTERGLRLTLAGAADSPFAAAWTARGLPLATTPIRSHSGLRRTDSPGRRAGPWQLASELWATMADVRHLVSLARRHDVVVSYSLKTHVAAVIAARIARRRCVVEVVDLVRPGLGRWLLRRAGRLATRVVVNSSATAELFTGSGAAVTVVHPGVDVDRFAPGPPEAAVRRELIDGEAGARVVGIVGRLDPEKGIETVAQAVRRLRDDGWSIRLAVVGDQGVTSAERVAQLREAVSVTLGDAVRFTGRVADVPGVLRALDVLVNASDAEPFGLSILEAQATGVPVIATRSGGAVDLVEHEATGLLVEPRDPAGLAEALSRVLGDAELRDRVVRAGRAQAVERFRLDRQYDLMASCYAVGTLG